MATLWRNKNRRDKSNSVNEMVREKEERRAEQKAEEEEGQRSVTIVAIRSDRDH